MRNVFFQLLLLGCCLSTGSLQARESSPPDEAQIQALQTEFEQEMKTQLHQKNIDDYSFDEISDIAAQASKKVYGAHPQLMKKKVLFDLQQLSVFDPQGLSNYQVKESLALNDLQQEMVGQSKSISSYKDVLPLFYGRKPEYVAQILKRFLYARHSDFKQFGQRAMIAQFMPDKTYRMQASKQPQLVVKTFDDDLFVITVQVTESGLLEPLQVEWMQPQTAASTQP